MDDKGIFEQTWRKSLITDGVGSKCVISLVLKQISYLNLEMDWVILTIRIPIKVVHGSLLEASVISSIC